MNRRLHEALLGAIAAIGVLVLLGYASGVLAGRDLSDQSVKTGAVYRLYISACGKKQSAIDVARAQEISHDHANKLFDALDECQNIPLTFRVAAIVLTVTPAEGARVHVVEVEQVGDAAAKVYWLTTMQIVATVSKPGQKPSDEIQQPTKAKRQDT